MTLDNIDDGIKERKASKGLESILADFYRLTGKQSENKIIRAESFKGDRWVEIQKGDTYYIIVEHGYSNAEYKVDKKDLKSIIKRLIDREFPRSHQIRIKNYSKTKD